MAGETSHKVTVGVFDINTGKTVYLKAGDPTDRYFTNIAWSPDDKTVYMFELNRDQNDCRLISYDASTGEKTGELYRETDAKYVEPLILSFSCLGTTVHSLCRAEKMATTICIFAQSASRVAAWQAIPCRSM